MTQCSNAKPSACMKLTPNRPTDYESHGKVFDPESVKAMRQKSSRTVTAIPEAKESLMASHTDQILRGFSSITKKTGKLTQKYIA